MTQAIVSCPENAGTKQETKFKPGQSGNPLGKPKGTLNKSTHAVMCLLEGETEALTRKAIDKALEGDTTALKLCLDRLSPPVKPSAQRIILEGPLPQSLTGIARAFVTAAAAGDMPPDIAAQMISAVASVAKVEEMENVKERLAALEKAIKGKSK